MGLGLWPLRKRMRLVRWAVALTLVTLHLVMKAPVWALIARVDLTGSSSGYHRYMLGGPLHPAFQRLVASRLQGLQQMGNGACGILCNQYVYVAVMGGLVSLVLLYRDFQPELWGHRDGKETGERGSRAGMAPLVPGCRPCLPM